MDHRSDLFAFGGLIFIECQHALGKSRHGAITDLFAGGNDEVEKAAWTFVLSQFLFDTWGATIYMIGGVTAAACIFAGAKMIHDNTSK